jgi:hypothetical protein
MKKAVILLAVFTTFYCVKAQTNEDKKMDSFISELMKKMTIEEKIGN